MAHSILMVEDEEGIRTSLTSVLAEEGYAVEAVASGEDCLARLARGPVDVVLLDVWLPELDGLQTLERMRQHGPLPMVVMISGHASIESAVRATKLGAFDFVEKPLSIEITTRAVRKALEFLRLEEETRRLREELGGGYHVVGESVPMKALRQQIAIAAPTNGRVLIYGESGTGKELVARALHAASLRSGEPFVEANCAAIPDEQIARSLFREDLFYRLNVIPFYVPALRERAEDILSLARYFVAEFSAAYGRKPKELSDAAVAALMRYAWPGNVRELRNLIERLVIICPQARIEPHHLPPELFRGVPGLPSPPYATLQQARSAYEREFILHKLKENQWNMTRTAGALGLERSHLYRKMKSLGISAEE